MIIKKHYEDMKKLILLVLAAVVMAGCVTKKSHEKVFESMFGWSYRVLVIDSCEYVDGGNQLAHKGNCRFCKERREKELKELVKAIKGE